MSTPFQRLALNVVPLHGNTMLAEQIQANIVRLREARGWSRPDLGKRVSPPTSGQQIERLEKGYRGLDPIWIERIARALDVDPVSLIGGDTERFDLSPQVADGIALHLARFVLRGAEPDQEIALGLSQLLQAMSELFSRNPEARRDPLAASLAVDILSRQHAPKAS